MVLFQSIKTTIWYYYKTNKRIKPEYLLNIGYINSIKPLYLSDIDIIF